MGDSEDKMREFRAFMPPGSLDMMILQAIQQCWMMIPKEKKTVVQVETEMRRVFDPTNAPRDKE